MSITSTGLGKIAKKKVRRVRDLNERSPPAVLAPHVLYDRKVTQKILGDVSVATLQRMEAAGVLRPKRLIQSEQAQVYYTGKNLLEIVGDDDQAAVTAKGDGDAR